LAGSDLHKIEAGFACPLQGFVNRNCAEALTIVADEKNLSSPYAVVDPIFARYCSPLSFVWSK
jgi:hypothetical protein